MDDLISRNDLISREKVVKAVDRHSFYTDDGVCLDEDITIILEEVPYELPEVIRFKDINADEFKQKWSESMREVTIEDLKSLTERPHMKPGTEIIVKHPNGYSGMMYGESSLTIFDSHMREVLHTGSRSAETAEELYNTLELMPGFISLIEKIDELKEDAEDDNI